MNLRALASVWARANCPRADVRADFLQRIDDALHCGVGCSLVIGPKLTRVGAPYLVQCFCGEFFAFQLTPYQAAQLEVQAAELVAARGVTEHDHHRHPEPPVCLEQIVLESADRLDRTEPVVGVLKYRTNPLWAVRVAIQAACEPPGQASTQVYQHFDRLPRGKGILHFRLPPLGELSGRHGEPFAGAALLFFQLYLVGEPERESAAMSSQLGTGPGQFAPPPFAPSTASTKPVRLGEPWVAPTPLPLFLSPETLAREEVAAAGPQLPEQGPNLHRLRAISDIRAVLVEIG
jgi:hypothetical protein